MTELIESGAAEMTAERPKSRYQGDVFVARLRKRYARERRFRIAGFASIGVAAIMLVVLLGSIIAKGYTAFWQTEIQLTVELSAAEIDPTGSHDPAVLANANYTKLLRQSLYKLFPEVTSRQEQRKLNDMLSSGASYQLAHMVRDNPALVGTTVTVWFIASSDIDQLVKGYIPRDVPEDKRRVKDVQVKAVDHLKAAGNLAQKFNVGLFSGGDSREPELAGVWGAIKGSLLTMLVTVALALPVGVAAAIYLEEFAPTNRFTDFIEVNINNLAAVPSIVYGLLGLAVFLNVLGMPRSAPLAGGVVMALMTLPVIIIATRAALKAVPPSIRDAALGIGASPLQAVLHHRLPLAMPGILTGTILGTARALGETAPLLMIGMVAFIVDVPGSFTDSATVLPVQIYMWAGSAERAFAERTSAAIMVLLAFLILMNGLAVLLRKKFERRW